MDTQSMMSLDNLSLDSGDEQSNHWFYNLPAHSIKVDMNNLSSEKEFKNLKNGEFKVAAQKFARSTRFFWTESTPT